MITNDARVSMSTGLPYCSAWIDAIAHHIGQRFTREQARQHAKLYLKGLLSPIQRKNSRQLSESAGAATPYAIQHLLNRAVWDAEAVRDDLRDYVIARFGDPEALLVIGQQGFIKRGDHSAGVQRQFNRFSGHTENCQIGVFLSYASKHGHAFIDRDLFLPQAWTDDQVRCRRAGIPDRRAFASKSELAKQMIMRTLISSAPFSWITSTDEDCGNDARMHEWLESCQVPYLFPVDPACSTDASLMAATLALVDRLDARDWQTEDASPSTHAHTPSQPPRWARIEMPAAKYPQQRWLLIRKDRKKREKLTYFIVSAPCDSSLMKMVDIANQRNLIDEDFYAANDFVGLDQYEVRNWIGWYRHVTLALLAFAAHKIPMPAQQYRSDVTSRSE